MTGQETEKAYMHWLYQAAGMGSGGFLKKLEQTGTAQDIYDMARRGILEEKMHIRYKRKAQKIQDAVKDYDVMGRYREMTDRGIRLVTCREAGYPEKLAAVQDAPYVLYYAGRLPDSRKKSIALIGARNCSEYGRCMAREFGGALAQAGIQIISGMARGIDGIGQMAALGAGGYSLGVFGCGVDVCYPSGNRELYERLLREGGVCSEYPPGVAPRAMLFPPRNRIISGLCDGVLVIEAKEKSGTLITVDMALEQGREVYAVPGRATDALSAGCNRLIRQGAQLILSPQDMLEELQTGFRAFSEQAVCRQQTLFTSEGVQGELLQLLDFHPKSMDLLKEAYGNTYGKPVTVPALCQALLQLCADGYAGCSGGCYFLK